MGSMVAIVVGYATRELNSMTKLSAELISRFASKCDLGMTLLWDLPDHFCPLCEDGTNEYFGRLFGEVCSAVENAVVPNAGSFLRAVGPKQLLTADILALHVQSRFRQVFVANGSEVPTKLTESSAHHTVSEIFSIHPNFNMLNTTPSIDIGILAVVGDESRAITAHLIGHPGFRDFGDYASEKTVRPFFMGSLPAKGEGAHRIAGVQANKQGNTPIMAAYQDLYDEFRPTLIVLIGIGGGVSKELVENDVCVANAVVNYDSRSVTDEGIKHTLDPLPPIEPWLMEIWRTLERKHGEKLELDSIDGKKFKVRLGPIGSGGAVVKDEFAEIRAWLLSVCRKSTAVDTEAVGVAEQFWQNKLKHDHATRGYLIVRGISDGANKEKGDLYREACVRNSMIFLQEFVAHASPGFTNVLPQTS